jgi:HSP20 family protein
MEDLVSRFWGDGEEAWPTGRLIPSVDLSETPKALEVRVDLPGVKPKEIDIQVSGNLLTISGEKKEEKEEKGKTFHRIERYSGSFSRTMALPCAVNEDEVAAEYHDGVLTITLPKTEEAKTRKITVKT